MGSTPHERRQGKYGFAADHSLLFCAVIQMALAKNSGGHGASYARTAHARIRRTGSLYVVSGHPDAGGAPVDFGSDDNALTFTVAGIPDSVVNFASRATITKTG